MVRRWLTLINAEREALVAHVLPLIEAGRAATLPWSHYLLAGRTKRIGRGSRT